MCTMYRDLQKLRDLTLELIYRVEEQGNKLFILNKREDLINKIKNSNYDKTELKNVCKSLKIYELDNELQKQVKNQMNDIRLEIARLKKKQQGNQAYLTSRYGSGAIYSRFDKRY